MDYGSPGWILSPAEHDAYRRVDLSDEMLGQACERLCRLALKTLNVPFAMVSVVEGTMQQSRGYIVSDEPRPVGVLRTPLSQSICAYVVQSTEPLIIDDMLHHPSVEHTLVERDYNVAAYLGMPLVLHGKHVLGSFGAMDTKPRAWSEHDIEILRDLSASVLTEIELRHQIHRT